MTYTVKQKVPVRKGSVRWTFQLSIEAEPAASDPGLQEVVQVIYLLDPIYPNPVRVAGNRQNRFEIAFDSWGTFTVRVRIVLRNGSEIVTQHSLTAAPDAPLRGHLELDPALPVAEAKLQLAKRLNGINAFGDAARLLETVLPGPNAVPSKTEVAIVQKLVLATYKNTSLPAAERLDKALEILKQYPALTRKDDAETLGLLGAIYKRKWQVDGQVGHLERSLDYYYRGYEAGRTEAAKADKDSFECGAFPGINAAFLHDLLASVAIEGESMGADQHRAEAERIRTQIIQELGSLLQAEPAKKDWWRTVTMVEAYVGLGKYTEALEAVTEAEIAAADLWEKESTCLQIASLIRLQAGPDATLKELQTDENTRPAWEVLKKLTEGNADAVRRSFVGKVGLGLSGGGFRASLYHIGVLARLAERGVLRHVEVISCVSGGSIIGAHYYLALRQLLQTRLDAEITDEDYVKIVQDISASFVTGVQKNIRTRVIGDFSSNLKMIFSPDKYSRTERLGELYEHEIFRWISDGENQADRWLNDCFIQPPKPDGQGGQVIDDAFSPKLHNWRRKAKVPILVLNATTLNTGHMWQFTASWMGEPAEAIDGRIDANDRLRRVYYGEAPPDHQKVRLGRAVAASSCVPGLFDPIVLDKLFKDLTVRLVDGGVHDNQGIQALLEQDCSLLLISDACGQMDNVANPPKGSLGVVFRTNDILQARIRTAQAQDLRARQRAGVIKGALFVHLKMGLEVNPIDPIGYRDRLGALVPEEEESDSEQTDYLIDKEVQRRLAALRTDLDSFTDLEAFSLMTSGYRMTEVELRQLDFADDGEDHRHEWRFIGVEPTLRNEAGATPTYDEALRQLGVGSNLAFKVWMLLRPLKIVAVTLGVLAALGLICYVLKNWDQPLVAKTFGGLVLGLLGSWVAAAVTACFGERVHDAIYFKETFKRVLKGIALAAVGWAIAGLHLCIFDRLFLKVGRIGGGGRQAEPLPVPPQAPRRN